jgi:hypothetical protein
MDTETKIRLIKIGVRMGTYILVSNVAFFTMLELLPTRESRSGKIVMLISEVIIAEMMGVQSAVFVNDILLEGNIVNFVFFGR